MAKDKHADGMLCVTASGHLSDEPKVLSDSSPYVMKTKALSALPAHRPPGLFPSLTHSFVVSKKKKKSLSEVYGTMGQVYWTEKDVCECVILLPDKRAQ